MVITAIEGIKLAAEVQDLSRDDPTVAVLLIKVTTDEGLVGLGECNHSPDAAYGFLSAPPTHNIGSGIQGLLLGRDPLDRAALMAALYRGKRILGSQGDWTRGHPRYRCVPMGPDCSDPWRAVVQDDLG